VPNITDSIGPTEHGPCDARLGDTTARAGTGAPLAHPRAVRVGEARM